VPPQSGCRPRLDERLAEASGRGGQTDVAGEREVHSGAGGGAVDGGDDRLGRVAHRHEHAVALRSDLVDNGPLGPGLARFVHRLHVTARAKPLARAREDDGADVGVGGGSLHGVVQIVTERVAEGIQSLRSVQGQRGDGVAHVIEETLVIRHI